MQLMDTNQKGLYNALLEWGKSHIMSPQITSYLKKIEDYCKPFITDNALEGQLSRSIEELENQTKTAISVLSNTSLILSTEDDPIWHEAEDAFYTFDRINYLMDAVHFLIAPARKDVSSKITRKLDEIFSHVTSWLEEGNFSAMRFVKLNDTRCERLSDIPEEERYLFPWYEIYSEYDENALEIIIENFHDYLSKNWHKVSREIPKEQLVEIWYELNRDNQLFSFIKKEAVLHKKLLEAVAIPSSLKLLGLLSDESLDYNVTGHVEDAGVVRVCIGLVYDAISGVFSDSRKLYWTFLLGFCGTCLDDKQRFTLLDDVENRIKKISLAEMTGKEAKILNTLKLWFEGKCEDSQLVKVSFDVWSKMMEERAVNIPPMEYDETPESLWNAIMELREWKPNLVEIYLDPFVDWCRQKWQSICEPAAFYGTPVFSSSPGMTTQQPGTVELHLRNNPILLSLKPNPEGNYFILSSLESKRVLQCDNKNDYEDLWEYLEKTKGNYWGGCFIAEGNEPVPAPVCRITNLILTKKPMDFKKAIIGISSEKAFLEEFVQKLPAMISEGKGQLQDSLVTKVIILVISLE